MVADQKEERNTPEKDAGTRLYKCLIGNWFLCKTKPENPLPRRLLIN